MSTLIAKASQPWKGQSKSARVQSKLEFHHEASGSGSADNAASAKHEHFHLRQADRHLKYLVAAKTRRWSIQTFALRIHSSDMPKNFSSETGSNHHQHHWHSRKCNYGLRCSYDRKDRKSNVRKGKPCREECCAIARDRYAVQKYSAV